MSELLTALPRKEDLASALPKAQDFKLDGFDGMDTEISDLTSSIDSNFPQIDGDVSIDVAIPANLSADSVTSKLQEPLSSMSAINADSLSESVKSSALPVDVGTMDFNINAPMETIGNALAPDGQASTPTVEQNMPGFDSEEALFQLKKLAAAGAATPMRLVHMYLKVFSTFIDKATDKERLVELAAESLVEIYLGQFLKLGDNLPYSVMQDLKQLVQSDFCDQYEKLLNDIENSQTFDIDLLTKARKEIIPSLGILRKAHYTLNNFSNESIEDLQRTIDNIVEFTGEGEVVLQMFFDSIESKVLSVLEAVESPIKEIGNATGKISVFLEQTAEKAELAAKGVSATLTEKLQGIDQFLSGDLANNITDINLQIENFLVDVREETDSVVGSVKRGLASATDGVEQFFEKVNALKTKLESAVKGLSHNVDTKTEKAFIIAQQKIDEFLDKITAVLENESVKNALNDTKKGIDKFKKVMEEVSLQPVFDVIVTKTGDIEIKIEAIKVEELGVPQKTAIKLGAKVIKEVKVDEIIKPELLAIFKDLRDPISALIKELKQGVLQINQLIDDFAPGAIVRDQIENAGPFRDFIILLKKYEPSYLLKPLEEANSKLTKLVEQLDPDILISKLQGLYNELYDLVEALSPKKLNTMIMRDVGTITGELNSIKETKLEQIIVTVKETISLKKLLEGTGIEDIADAKFWDLLNYYMGGGFLVKIAEALTYVESEIKDKVVGLEINLHKDNMNKLVDLQISWNKTKMLNALNVVKTDMEGQLAKIKALENRRKQLLINRGDVPGYKDILNKLDLHPYISVEQIVNTILNEQDKITNALYLISKRLNDNKGKLDELVEDALKNAAPVVFKKQLSDPINKIVINIEEKLKVFKDAVEAIKQIIDTLQKLPAEMDKKVAEVLDAAVDDIKEVLESTIAAINQAAEALISSNTNTYNNLVSTLDKYSPYGLLNSFAASDFEDDDLEFLRNLLKSSPPSDEISIFMSNKLTTEQQGILDVDGVDWKGIVITALNDSVFDSKLNAKRDIAKTTIDQKIAELNGTRGVDANQMSRYATMSSQLDKMASPRNKHEKIRLSRVILEATYPDQINMSLQSLHPFIVDQISRLYPKELVTRLDETYLGVINKVKGIPERLIQKPLDAKYNELKSMFLENFDIEGVFRVLEVKLDGMDEDLELGLDKVSFAFNHLIDTLNSRLA